MKRLGILLLFIVSTSSYSIAQEDEKEKLTQQYQEDMSQLDDKIHTCSSQVIDRQGDVEAFRPQHKQMLNEIRQGLMCDQCSNTKSEIERRGEPFEKHLARVGGEPVPIPEEQRRRKIEDIDQLLRELQEEVDKQLKKCSSLDEDRDKRTETYNSDLADLQEKERLEKQKLAEEAAAKKKKEEEAEKAAEAEAESKRLEAARRAEEERQRKIQQQLDYNAQVAARQSAQNLNRYNNNQNTIQNQQLDNSSGQVYDNARSMNSYNASSHSLGSGSDVDYSDQAIEDNSYSGETYEDIFAEYRDNAVENMMDFDVNSIPFVEEISESYNEAVDFYEEHLEPGLGTPSELISPKVQQKFRSWVHKDMIGGLVDLEFEDNSYISNIGKKVGKITKNIHGAYRAVSDSNIGGAAKFLMDKAAGFKSNAGANLEYIADYGDEMIGHVDRIIPGSWEELENYSSEDAEDAFKGMQDSVKNLLVKATFGWFPQW